MQRRLGRTGVAYASLKADGSARVCRTLPLADIGSPCWTDTESRRINASAPDGILHGHCGDARYRL
jgi:hypothetical protein